MCSANVDVIVIWSIELALNPALEGSVAAGARGQTERHHGSKNDKRQKE